MEFAISAGKQITVSQLGRYKASGNNKIHEVRLIRVNPPGSITPSKTVASVSVDMTDTADSDGLVYAKLPAPVWLEPGMTYRLLSREHQSGDQYYDQSTVSITGSSGVLDLSGVVANVTAGYFPLNSDGSFNAWTAGSSTKSYGPVNMKCE
jgi:hypothetical protein